MRINLKTLGCRLNEAELETWAQQFQKAGHHVVREASDADLIVLNSCAVTEDAVKKSRYLIRKTHRENPRAKLVVSGCYATLNQGEVANALSVDLVIGNADKARLVEIAQEKLELPTMPAFSTEPGEFSLFSMGRQRAFIKVQDGCRYRCTFCIVTVARGEEQSRPVDQVIQEINALHEQGIQEIVLTGVHLGGYGSDLGLRLEHLLEAILDQTAIPRLRIGSLEPWELSDGFIELMSQPRLMPHLHLPLQSGSDTVLRRMARRTRTREFATLVEQLRTRVPNLNITTDIIVGFPGETEAEWGESLDFIETQGFGHIHIFAYSPRAGTKAAQLASPVDGAVKKARSQQLHDLAARQKTLFMQRFRGTSQAVLWEAGQTVQGQAQRRFFGYTPNYLKVETLSTEELTGRIELVELERLAMDLDHLFARCTPSQAR